MDGKRTAVIGAGRLGTALAKVLTRKGHDVIGIAARSAASRDRAGRTVPALPVRTAEDLAEDSDILFLTVSDDALEGVTATLVESGAIHQGQRIIHVSGRCGISAIECVERAAAVPMALHPAMTFAGTDADYAHFEGLPFGVTARPQFRDEAEAIAKDLGGVAVWIPEESRVLYHAALCFGANNLITLISAAVEALRAAGIDNAEELIAPLVRTSLGNALDLGDQALTGPVRRADVGTIAAHLAAFEKATPGLVDAYRNFGLFTAQRALDAGLNDASLLHKSMEALRH